MISLKYVVHLLFCELKYNEVSQLLLNAQVSSCYFIATFTENVKNHKCLANRKR